MRTLLENLREDERTVLLLAKSLKVGGRYLANDIAQAIAEIERQHQEIKYLKRVISWPVTGD